MKTFRLQESKTTLLKKLLNNGNITEEQFHIADDFFKKHNAFEKEIDWNRGLNITWDELSSVIYKERNNKSQAKKKIRKGLEGFTEGKDYLVLEEGKYKGEPWVAYQPFTWEASRMIASHYVEPTEGYKGDMDAGWCTAYQKKRTYWDKHNKIEAFIYICGETIPTKKVAISISEKIYDASGSDFLYSLSNLNYNIWDFKDYNYTIEEEELLEVVPNLYNLIEKAYDNWDDRITERLLSEFKLNPKTNRYDYEGSLYEDKLYYFVAEDGDGFTINFGSVTGDFSCSKLKLTSLKGSPREVGNYFDCSSNKLTSLKGAPQKVGRWFNCSDNHLTSLEGASQTVCEDFYCYDNELTSLKGAPETVEGDFVCHSNQLTSLEGAPLEVGGGFNCFGNRLTSLKGSPQTVGGKFVCNENYLTSLEGAPLKVGGNFYCRSNNDLHSLNGIGEVKGNIYKDF